MIDAFYFKGCLETIDLLENIINFCGNEDILNIVTKIKMHSDSKLPTPLSTIVLKDKKIIEEKENQLLTGIRDISNYIIQKIDRKSIDSLNELLTSLKIKIQVYLDQTQFTETDKVQKDSDYQSSVSLSDEVLHILKDETIKAVPELKPNKNQLVPDIPEDDIDQKKILDDLRKKLLEH